MSAVPETRILFVGDMHLGRAPGGFLPVVNDPELSPAAALKRLVTLAIDRQVHAVAFAGDLVESGNALFEAAGPLQQAVGELERHHIEVIAVAGNHDTRVLPRLVRMMGSGFQVLGSGGTWSSHLVAGQAPLPVRLVGWSFPSAHCQTSPLQKSPPRPQAGEVTLGLLHADLDVATSSYAPVPSRQLSATGYQGWFLGHIHRPGTPSTEGAPFYLGSLTPLDPTETGAHGPVLVTVHADSSLAVVRLPLAPLRWEHLVVRCPDPANGLEDLRALLLERMLATLRDLPRADLPLRALGFRIRLTGRVRGPNAVHEAVATLQAENLVSFQQETKVFVDKLECDVTGAHDLERMAAHGDPIGLLARRILTLENNQTTTSDVSAGLLAAAEDLQKELGRTGNYTLLELQKQEFEPDPLRRTLIKVAHRLLDAMVDERGDDRASA